MLKCKTPEDKYYNVFMYFVRSSSSFGEGMKRYSNWSKAHTEELEAEIWIRELLIVIMKIAIKKLMARKTELLIKKASMRPQ